MNLDLPGSISGHNSRWRGLDGEPSPQLAEWLALVAAGANAATSFTSTVTTRR